MNSDRKNSSSFGTIQIQLCSFRDLDQLDWSSTVTFLDPSFCFPFYFIYILPTVQQWKNAEFTISTSCLQCKRGGTGEYHRINVMLKKMLTHEEYKASSAVIRAPVILLLLSRFMDVSSHRDTWDPEVTWKSQLNRTTCVLCACVQIWPSYDSMMSHKVVKTRFFSKVRSLTHTHTHAHAHTHTHTRPWGGDTTSSFSHIIQK